MYICKHALKEVMPSVMTILFPRCILSSTKYRGPSMGDLSLSCWPVAFKRLSKE